MSKIKQDEGLLLTDEEILEHFPTISYGDAVGGQIHKRKYDSIELEEARDIAKAQLAKVTKPLKKAGAKEERERILGIITEDFVEMVGNFYMTNENRKLAFELWRGIRKRLLKGDKNA